MNNFKFHKQTGFYSGKVRDVFTISDKWLVMIASDRISAFDVILPRTIPYKGQVLNQIAAYMLDATSDICKNWLLTTPTPNSAIGIRCIPFKVEMVIRGNLTGHAWRTYQESKRVLCGVTLPEGLKENDFFPTPIITPSTKASVGHDEDISREDIISKGIVSEADYQAIEQYTYDLFERGKALAAKQRLILVDTKYEFGKAYNEAGEYICLMDEIHTPDSSRYFYADGYEERQAKGEKQRQLSKEFVREWLIENNFMGKDGQTVPAMSDEWINTISNRYIELYEQVIGEKFTPQDLTEEDTVSRINKSIEELDVEMAG
ncbi:phosphoribosylaminoimidazolesuccinocarboxamide synthase [soil metagenome]